MARRGYEDWEKHYRLVSRIVAEFGKQATFTPPKTKLDYSQALFLAKGKTNPSLQTVRMFAQWSAGDNLDRLVSSLSETWKMGFDDRKISTGRHLPAHRFLEMLDGRSTVTDRHKMHIWEHLIKREQGYWDYDPKHISKNTLSKLGVSFISSTKTTSQPPSAEKQRINTRPARRARTFG